MKELTVREISEALGYEVKVVKEQPESYQFKGGDVVKTDWNLIRIILYIDGKSKSFDCNGFHQSTGQQSFETNNYRKIGELKDYIK